LQTDPAMSANRLRRTVTRCERRLGGLARHGTRTWWHDDRGIGMAGSDLAVDAVLVVCAIAGQRSDGTINLVEQGTDLRAVIDINWWSAPPPRPGRCRHRHRCAVCTTTGAGSY